MTGKAFTEEALEAGIRDVADEEVAFYEEHGWVKMDGLVSPDLVEVLRSEAEPFLEAVEDHTFRRWSNASGLASRGIEPFRSFVFSEQMCRVAHRLINRKRLTDAEIPTRLRGDG